MFNFFNKIKKPEKVSYQLVEAQLDDQHYRQGVRITTGKYSGLVFTTRPKVELKEIEGNFHLNFEYNVEYAPANLKEINHTELKNVVGDILLELIEKDYDASGTADSKHSD